MQTAPCSAKVSRIHAQIIEVVRQSAHINDLKFSSHTGDPLDIQNGQTKFGQGLRETNDYTQQGKAQSSGAPCKPVK